MTDFPGHPDYGIDAPGLVARFASFGAMGLVGAPLVSHFLGESYPAVADNLATTLTWMGGAFLSTAAAMVVGSKVLKLRYREKLVNGLELGGAERVLDVGCGRGLMLNAVARRLPDGIAVGLDLWQKEDQSGNHPDRTRENARAEGVAERVDVRTGDMREMPFADEAFDAVVSSWAIHNIYDPEGRARALREMVRVLRPSGS
jgi:SAM-dependent methyltransferase